jgi:hypothetical protein
MKINRYLLLPALLLATVFGCGLAAFTDIHAGAASKTTNESAFFGRRLAVYGVHAPVGASIATTSATDTYFQVPKSGRVVSMKFSSLAALATSDTNYITWTVVNLGQAGAGSTALLSTADTNTTKATGGSAIVASSSRSLVLSGTATNLDVLEGDVIRIRATATGTLAGAVTVPSYSVLISANGA